MESDTVGILAVEISKLAVARFSISELKDWRKVFGLSSPLFETTRCVLY